MHAAMSCAGNLDLHTPAMDALAARGVRFTRAYCSYPLCSPSRASLQTGRYPHQVNCNANRGHFWDDLPPTTPVLGQGLAEVGYNCAWAGKDWPQDGQSPFRVLCRWGDRRTATHASAFIRAAGDRPFLLVANFVNPHNICEFARDETLYEGPLDFEPETEAMPSLPANFAIPPHEPAIIRVAQRQGHRMYQPRNYTPDEWRRYRWAYYRMVEKVDAQLGRVLAALEESGHRDDTLVILTSDHGDGCGAHQWNQKMVLYEEVVRVPLIVAGPGVQHDAVESRLIEAGLDILPTCQEAAGVPIPDGVEGRSLLPLCRGDRPDAWRDAAFVETSLDIDMEGRKPQRDRGRAVITERHKYTVWAWGKHREYLVDLAADPGEMVNLAVNRRYHSLRGDMRRRLYDWCQRTGDTFCVPGHEVLSPEE
jgi:choline-sulfatase